MGEASRRALAMGSCGVVERCVGTTDSLLFTTLAFGGVYTWGVVFSIFWANVVIKAVVTVVSIPWIYLVRPEPVPGLVD